MDYYDYWCLQKLREKVAQKYKGVNIIEWNSVTLKDFQVYLEKSTKNFSFIGEKKLFLLLRQHDQDTDIKGDDKIDILCRFVGTKDWKRFKEQIKEEFYASQEANSPKAIPTPPPPVHSKREDIGPKTTISRQLIWVIILVPLLTVSLFFLVSYFWDSNENTSTTTAVVDDSNAFKICVTDAITKNSLPSAEITVWKEGKIQGIYNGADNACYLLPADGSTIKVTVSCDGYFTSDTLTYVAQAVNFTLALPPLGIIQNNIDLIEENSSILQDYDSWNENRRKAQNTYTENLVVVIVNEEGVEQEKMNRAEFLEIITKPQSQIESLTTKVALSNSAQKIYFMVVELKYVGI